MAYSSLVEDSTEIEWTRFDSLKASPIFLVVCAERRRQQAVKQSSAATRQSKPVTALVGIQGHTGTSNMNLEATLMMVRDNLDSRDSST